MLKKERYLSAKEAAELLNVSAATLYAYVSRGLIRSEAGGDKRQRRYYADDIEKLLQRREARRNPEALTAEALQWGAPVLESALTLITEGRLYYRGYDALELAESASIEEVAALLWTGRMENAAALFSEEVSANKYETMLLHLAMDGSDLSPMQTLQTLLPLAAADDTAAYDLRAATVARTGARILRLMVSVIAGDIPENLPIANTLRQAWSPDERTEKLINAALILCADHELNVSSFTARVVASAGSTPYGVVTAGLAALQGVRHGGYTGRVEAFMREARSADMVRQVMMGRLQRGEAIPGFGHRLYPDGDPRAALLLEWLRQEYGGSAIMNMTDTAIQCGAEFLREKPTIDWALVSLTKTLNLADGMALALFALGRAVGWIAHAIEQYDTNSLIRPRAKYIGTLPQE